MSQGNGSVNTTLLGQVVVGPFGKAGVVVAVAYAYPDINGEGWFDLLVRPNDDGNLEVWGACSCRILN